MKDPFQVKSSQVPGCRVCISSSHSGRKQYCTHSHLTSGAHSILRHELRAVPRIALPRGGSALPEPSSTKSTLPSSYGRLLPNSKYSTFFRNANGSYAFRPGQTDRYTSKELIPEAIPTTVRCRRRATTGLNKYNLPRDLGATYRY